jgi:hypothetical protein
MKSWRILASLSALSCFSILACGSSSSPSEDTGGHAATGGAANTGAGGAATGNNGSAGLADSGVAGRGSGGTVGAGSGGSAAAGSGGSRVAGTGGALGDAGSLGAAGGTVGAGSGGSAAAGSGGSRVAGTGGALGDAGSLGAAGATGGGGGAITGVAGPVAGTTSIFDGKTLNGWEQGTAMLWSVVDGVIDGKGTTGGQLLMTQTDYGDFRIVVSSNMVAVGGTGHLGICFWGGRMPVGGYNGCKLIIPDSRGDTWDYSLNSGLKGVTKVGTPAANPTWNTTEILCFLKRGFCRVAMNGTAILTYQEPNLKSIKAGPIGLQIHDGKNEEVQYKDVYVDPAPTVDQLLTVK